jgi:glycosyltransferase involved in cell wall biosynthesis
MRLSVILCTRNPRERYFSRCLHALRSQTIPSERWELIAVDNSSEPPVETAGVWKGRSGWRIVRETALGLTPARLRGIRESTGDILVFVDDDNVIDGDYLETALRIADDKPFLGSWSGQCRPEFEEPPPEWTRRYWGNLVIREFDSDVWSNLPRLPDSMPCGAGLCVRRNVAEHYVSLHQAGKRAFQFDRAGDSLMSGGDNDLAACACDLGLGVGIMTSLRLTHLIPPERLALDYLCRLSEGVYYSGAVLDYYRGVRDRDPSVARRVVFWLRLPSLPSKHAQIAMAVERGRSRARRFIAAAERVREES